MMNASRPRDYPVFFLCLALLASFPFACATAKSTVPTAREAPAISAAPAAATAPVVAPAAPMAVPVADQATPTGPAAPTAPATKTAAIPSAPAASSTTAAPPAKSENPVLREYASLLSPDPELAAIGSIEDPLPLHSLLRASLVASGLKAELIPDYETRLRAILDRLAAAVETGGAPDQASRAEAALVFLHDEVFRHYELDATTIDGILDEGRFNCVSSALFYALALKRLGIPMAGVRTEDHAFCLVRLSDREIDVETTNRSGFDPGTKKEFADAFGQVTGYAYVPPTAYARRRKIGEKELAALVLSNRAATLDGRKLYREALSLGASYAALVSGPEGLDFLFDRLNNLVVDLEQRRDFSGAGLLVDAASELYPAAPRLAELRVVVSYNRAVSYAEAGRWDELLAAVRLMAADQAAAASGASGSGNAADRAATSAADRAGLADAAVSALVKRRVEALDFAGARAFLEENRGLCNAKSAALIAAQIAEAELADAARRLSFGEALAVADRVLAAKEIEPRRWAEFLAWIYGGEANRLAGGGDWLGAAALAAEGAAKAPGDGSLARAAKIFRGNFVVEQHNRFAELYNRHDFAGARAVAEKALAALPGDATLLKDLELAKEALKP